MAAVAVSVWDGDGAADVADGGVGLEMAELVVKGGHLGAAVLQAKLLFMDPVDNLIETACDIRQGRPGVGGRPERRMVVSADGRRRHRRGVTPVGVGT